jgi:hypothetical protein
MTIPGIPPPAPFTATATATAAQRVSAGPGCDAGQCHRHLKITDEQRQRFIAVYLDTLDEAGLPADAPFRQAVREHVEFGSLVAQQNSWAESDADLHPIRAVPAWQWPGGPQDH